MAKNRRRRLWMTPKGTFINNVVIEGGRGQNVRIYLVKRLQRGREGVIKSGKCDDVIYE